MAERWCLAVPEALPDSFMKMLYDRKFDIIEMTAENATQVFVNVLALGSRKMLLFKWNVALNKKLRGLGFEVLDPSLGENKKGGGGPHCLTFEVERECK